MGMNSSNDLLNVSLFVCLFSDLVPETYALPQTESDEGELIGTVVIAVFGVVILVVFVSDIPTLIHGYHSAREPHMPRVKHKPKHKTKPRMRAR